MLDCLSLAKLLPFIYKTKEKLKMGSPTIDVTFVPNAEVDPAVIKAGLIPVCVHFYPGRDETEIDYLKVEGCRIVRADLRSSKKDWTLLWRRSRDTCEYEKYPFKYVIPAEKTERGGTSEVIFLKPQPDCPDIVTVTAHSTFWFSSVHCRLQFSY